RITLRFQAAVIVASLLLAASTALFVFGLDLPLPEWLAQRVGTDNLTIKPIGRELVPTEDQNRFIINVICPVGSSIDYVDEMLRKGEDVLINLNDPVTKKDVIAGMFAAVSIRPGQLISEGTLFVRLIPSD